MVPSCVFCPFPSYDTMTVNCVLLSATSVGDPQTHISRLGPLLSSFIPLVHSIHSNHIKAFAGSTNELSTGDAQTTHSQLLLPCACKLIFLYNQVVHLSTEYIWQLRNNHLGWRLNLLSTETELYILIHMLEARGLKCGCLHCRA